MILFLCYQMFTIHLNLLVFTIFNYFLQVLKINYVGEIILEIVIHMTYDNLQD